MPPKHGHDNDRHDNDRNDNDRRGDDHHGQGQHGGQHEDRGADKLIGGRGGHSGGDGGRGGGSGGAGSGGAGHGQNMSPELKQAIDTAKQDRVELQNAAPENKAQCAEALKNSEAEVVRLGGNLGMLGQAQHAGGPGDRSDKGADELIGGRGGHQGGGGGRGGRGGRGGHDRDD